MHDVRLHALNDFGEWRRAARDLLRAGIAPEEIAWREPDAAAELFGGEGPAVPAGADPRPAGSVPAAFVELAADVVAHRDPERFGLLYRALWRLQADRHLLAVSSDPDVVRLTRMRSAVHRDSHKMKAFVRFKSIADDSGFDRFAAWFEPEHYTLERTAPFFERRFSGMMWAILTPYRSAYWDGDTLLFGEGGRKADVPRDDAVEADWKTYFASIFNPARLKISMMKSEMPVKYWRNLPEADLIAPLIRGAKEAEQAMVERASSQPPSHHVKRLERQVAEPDQAVEIANLADAHAAIGGCRRCPLYEHATQPVFGEGPPQASLMFVGEQPGNEEDLGGKPFVGPAGRVFDAALKRVGIDRSTVYVTNAVKHFKYTPRGKRRLHQRPNAGEIAACKFWLNLELNLVAPRVIVALGATAAQSLTGKAAAIGKMRGVPIVLGDGTTLFVTNHPSYLLRIPDQDVQAREREKFDADLALVRDYCETLKPRAAAGDLRNLAK